MPKQKLFEEDSEEEVSIKTENEYAKKYDAWREKEELHKLEQKYGSKALNSDASESSDSEDESDEPPEVSEEVEKLFLKTLSLLKTKDPRIYDPNFKCFDEEIKKEKVKEQETKKLTFGDSEDDSDDDPNIFSIEKKAEIDQSDDEEKKPLKDDKIKDYLVGKVEHVDEDVEKELAPLRALWSDPKLNDGEAFLRDYILNKRYLEKGDAGEAGDKIRDDDDLEEDEKTVEEQGKFERAYNFRFEEPDEEYLKRFPRTMNYIRPKDDRRSRKRAEVRQRKEEEKMKKMEEIARMKALKLKEIQEKIAKIKEVTGNVDLAFKDQDIEGDFDPEEHDRRMKALFDEEYYGEADDQKPVFPDLDEELEIENWDKYEQECDEGAGDAQADAAPHCDDEDFNMDADYDPKKSKENLLEELKRSTGKKRRNRKKKSKLAELLKDDKPKFVPNIDKTYSDFMEEYYKMDCEDVIGGDLPTRFKYREVVPNDYGLSIEEILLADDKELTQWVPLKKIVRYRPDNVEKGEVKTYSQKAADMRLKKKILPSLFKDLPEEPEIVVSPGEINRKKKKKNKNKNQDDQEESVDTEANKNNTPDNSVDTTKKKKKRKNKGNGEVEDNLEIDIETKAMNSVQAETSTAIINDSIENSNEINVNFENIQTVNRKKKKKNKNKENKQETCQNENNIVNNSEEICSKMKKRKTKENDNVQAHTSNKESIKESVTIDSDKNENSNDHNNVIPKNIQNIGKKKKRKYANSFTIDNVTNEKPSKIDNDEINSGNMEREHKTKRKLKDSTVIPTTTNEGKLEGNLKRKIDSDTNEVPKKKKKKNKQKQAANKSNNKKDFKNKNNKEGDKSNNPLSKLSDERLKAYGLNPKKYRSFLKYKKF